MKSDDPDAGGTGSVAGPHGHSGGVSAAAAHRSGDDMQDDGAPRAGVQSDADAAAEIDDEAGFDPDRDAAGRAELAPGWRPRGAIPAGLHLVATPIGNAGDVTLRALDILARADALAAEDTRVLRRLMEIHGVPVGGRQLISYNDRNGPQRRPGLLALLREGKSVAYCSDAGTPLVSDPGWKLAAEALEEGLPLTAAPGASAALTALCLSGLPSDRFLFEGFLPTKAGARRRALEELARIPATLIFYEAPRRAAETLAEMARTLGPDRRAAFCRELTKRFEEVTRGTLAELAARFAEAPAPRGEAAIVVGPPEGAAPTAEATDPDAMLREAMARLSVKDAAREVAAATGLKRADLYARALALREAGD